MSQAEATPRDHPFVWVTWLASTMAGAECGWAPWFRTNHELLAKQPEDPDAPMWRARHEAIVDAVDEEVQGTGLPTERELKLKVAFDGGLAVFGKADLVATDVQQGLIEIFEMKGGWAKLADEMQLLIYMWLMEATLEEQEEWAIHGWLVRKDGRRVFEGLPGGFEDSMFQGLDVLTSDQSPPRIPGSHCRFCPITKLDCPVRQS